MTARLSKWLSLGDRPLAAALAYFGLGLMLWAALPEAQPALAGCNGPEEGCPAGYKCCHGDCVPDSYVCCGDGSYGPGATCFCCSTCADSACTSPTTLLCPTPEDCP